MCAIEFSPRRQDVDQFMAHRHDDPFEKHEDRKNFASNLTLSIDRIQPTGKSPDKVLNIPHLYKTKKDGA
jgi:hypothetical protein